MAGIYKAYDIRGIYPDQLDEQTAHKIARAYADMIKEEYSDSTSKPTIVVGKDMRLSSPQLHQSVIDGITRQGVNVIDIGLVSTPTFYFAVSELKAQGGMVVSASHNPKEYNGIKIVKHKALPVGYDTGINEIERRVQAQEFKTADQEGESTIHEGIVEEDVKFSLQHANLEKIKKYKIVIDTANAMGVQYLKALFEHIPADITWMNDELDGSFPSHPADPFKDENVADIKTKVKEVGADLGITTDGDGDRIFFIDNKGEMIDPAIVRGIIAKIVLKEHPGATICYDIRPGRITRDMINQYGGKPVVTRVGHSLIKAKAIEIGAKFAGESSGHFFMETEYGFFETPMIVTLKMLEEFSESGQTVAEYVAPLKKYAHSGEINSKVADKQKVMEKLKTVHAAAEISTLDGVTITYPTFWFNVRPSNTEPVLRLNLEAVSEEIMKEKVEDVLKIIRE